MVYSDLGDNKNAADVLKRLADKNPSGRSLAALASTYEQMRDYGLAAETLKKAIELSPASSGELKRALAQDLMLADRLDESLALYQEAVAEDPKDVQSQLRISQIYRQKRDFVKAREASDKARALDANNIEIRYNEVNLLEAEGRNADAIAAMKDILATTAKKSYNPAERGNRAALLERLGFMYRNNEQFGPAVETFRQLAEVDPDLGAAGDPGRRWLALVRHGRGDIALRRRRTLSSGGSGGARSGFRSGAFPGGQEDGEPEEAFLL
jgi:tetratricopeptide (TPR) repeat protein